MTKTRMQQTAQLGTDFWNDSCDLEELSEAVSNGAVGATSNPVIVSQVAGSHLDQWGPVIDQLITDYPKLSEIEIGWMLVEIIGREASKLLLPVFEQSKGRKGRLSVQVNPVFYRDPEAMISHAEKIAEIAPNIAIKAPVTSAGLAAMEEMTARGISVTATVSFTVPQALAAAEAVERGLKKAHKAGISTNAMSPMVVVMVGRLDDHLKRVAAREQIVVEPGYLEWAGIAVVKKLYTIFRQRGYQSRLLSAAYRNHMQWSEFVGGDLALTIPYTWWKRFDASDVPAEDRINIPVDKHIIRTLAEHFPDFNRAYEENGMNIDDFASYGSTVHTLRQFIEGYAELLSLIRGRMLKER